MSTPFQNRLVGTIIVAAAIIIFLPDILDGEKSSNQADFDAIPQAPTFTGKLTNKNFPDEKLVLEEEPTIFKEEAKDEQLLLNDNRSPEPNVQPADANNEQTAKITPASKPKEIVGDDNLADSNETVIDKPRLGHQPTEAINKEAWVIQLGSFRHASNVAELVEKLKKNGYIVFTQPIQTRKGTLTKVFVGPELIQSSLADKLPALKELTNVQGKIARFYPNK